MVLTIYDRGMPSLSLHQFDLADLPVVEPWFHDTDTQRWLGGPGWPRLVLELAGQPLVEFRGRTVTGSHRWLARDGDHVVGYIDCGTTDRFTEWDQDHGVLDVLPVPSGNISYVVDPTQRRRGYAVAMLDTLWTQPELGLVRLMVAGVEPANVGSVRCLRKAGYQPLHTEPDWEGIVYYTRLRTLRNKRV